MPADVLHPAKSATSVGTDRYRLAAHGVLSLGDSGRSTVSPSRDHGARARIDTPQATVEPLPRCVESNRDLYLAV